MFRSESALLHRGGRVRGFLLKDPSLSLLNNTSSYRNLKRTGSHGANSFGKSSPKVGDLYGTAQ